MNPPNPPSPPVPTMPCARVCWHHVRASVPSDWEVTAYSVEDRAGRLEFGTRAGLMGIVSWEPCDREPDRQTTMLSFLRNNVLGKDQGRQLATDALRTAAIGPFEMGWIDDGGPCQALAYSSAAKKLVRWVFEPLAAGGMNWRARVAPVLESFDFNEDDRVEFWLHGVHALLPREYQIEDIAALPANVMMAFESAETQRRATFRRWGLPDMLLAGESLGAFHARILKTGGCLVQSVSACTVNGMEACLSIYDAPREHHMDRFMGRRWPGGRAVLWHDRNEQRLYAFEQVGPAKSAVLEFAETLPGRTLSVEA